MNPVHPIGTVSAYVHTVIAAWEGFDDRHHKEK